MTRSIRKSVILAKVETTSGTDAAPSNTADAVLFHVQNLSCKVEQQFADRDVVTGVFASPDKLPFTRRGTITFTVDAASVGVANLGNAPPIDALLQGVGLASTLSAGVSATYNDVSTALKTLTIWAYWDGELRKFAYAAGNMTGDFSVGNVPTFTFTFQALVTSVTAASNPTPTLTAFQRPQAVGPATTSKLTLGGTLSGSTISGGTAYNFKTLTFDLGNDVQFDTLATQETVAIYGRNSTLSCTLDLGVTDEVQKYTDMAAGTTASIGFKQGNASGSYLVPFFGAGIITGVSDQVDGNKVLSALTFTLKAVTANDMLKLVFA
ncbi:MAG: hypothetical protein YHS30scaffold667_19 [Phage 65_10]|nr:MAG: hypothetical protein YHS30scaffold667_19 [Phage 65_10]